jgi:hypothetical protein
MTDLSPAAQAVRDAALATYDKSIPKDDSLWALDRASVVAALRAVADQVVPLPRLPYDSCCDVSASAIRAELLAIAAELEGSND